MSNTSAIASNDGITDASRGEEESRIVSTWLKRLRSCLTDQHQSLFHQALRESSISPADLDGGRVIRQNQLDNVLRLVRAQVPDITLRLFDRVEVLDLGLIGYAAINCGTLGKALEVMYAYHSLTSDRYTDQLQVQEDRAVIFTNPLPGYLGDSQDITEDSFAGNWRSLKILLGDTADSGKIELHFEHPEPSYIATYHEVFGPNCHFNRERAQLSFPKSWLEVPINRSGGGLSQVFTAMCERILGPGEAKADTSEMVQRLLLTRSGRSMLRLEGAAEQLLLSPNQLRKRLYRAGTTYKALVLKTRMELARHYLLDTHLSVQEIAYLLDYSQAAPFSRAFKLYCGVAPEYFRQGQQQT
jgi:AraC-like DNA-binding protein